MLNDKEQLLTPTEVANQLNVSVQTVKHWLRTGRIPGYKVGRLWRIRKNDLLRFIEPQLSPKLITWRCEACEVESKGIMDLDQEFLPIEGHFADQVKEAIPGCPRCGCRMGMIV